MSDMGEVFSALRKGKQAKRASNTDASTDMLKTAGAQFTSLNDGAHLVVLAGKYTVDFWPSTGLWMVRGQKGKTRGVGKLLAFVKQQGDDK